MRKLTLILSLTLAVLSQNVSAQLVGCRTIEKNPANNQFIPRFAIDSAKHRGMADNYYLWDNGAVLKVKFLTGSKALQEKIFKIAKQWEQFANVKFQWVQMGDADIRVRLSKDEGHYSYLGTYSRQIKPQYHTMCLDTIDLKNPQALNGTVLHEFGHALGLLHEHESPVSGIQWNKEKIYEEYQRTQGWTKEEIDYQVFSVYDASYTNGTKYDSKSIMHYPISKWETLNGYSVPWNRTLSEGDKELIAALYPKKGKRVNEVSRLSINNFYKMEVVENVKKNGLSLYPAFELTGAGKSGKAYLVAEFFDETGFPLVDTDNTYRFNNNVAAIRSIMFLPGRKTSYNTSKKDFEMFIPYDQLEGVQNVTTLIIRFRVILETAHGEMKNIYQAPLSYYSRKNN